MGLTTDRNDPALRQIQPDGQQASYLVLSEEERKKGFVRPVRHKYIHLKCGGVTSMGQALSETFAHSPRFYTGTYCAICMAHFDLFTDDGWQFLWDHDGDPVGSDAKEAEEYLAAERLRRAAKNNGAGI
jgi:hypothetical protein